MGLYFGGPDEADFGNGRPPVWGQPGLAVYAQPQFGSPGPVVWGQPNAGYRGAAFGADYEIIGAYEILGDPTSSPAKQALAQSIIAAKQLGGKAVLQTAPRREYSQVLPCTSLAVTTADPVRDIELKPQRPFRPEKFRASSTHTAPFFVITAYSIGQDNQFVGPGSIPVDLFSEVALYSQIEAYTANLGNLITMTVQNIDDETRDFRAAFFGTSLGN